MVDPTNFTNFNRTVSELEELLIFSICVAGKPAMRTAKAVANLLAYCDSASIAPFDIIRWLIKGNLLVAAMEAQGIGQYSRIGRALKESVEANLDLRKCSVEDLESIHGIGPKTARMFILHTRPNQRIAALDTHILKFLKEKGHDVPKTTPSGKRYLTLEQAFLTEADKSGMTVADFDLHLWRKYSGN